VAQKTGRVKVNLPPDDRAQLVLHAKEIPARRLAVFEHNKDTNIAIGPEILSQDGTEQTQPLDGVAPAKVGNAIFVYVDRRGDHEDPSENEGDARSPEFSALFGMPVRSMLSIMANLSRSFKTKSSFGRRLDGISADANTRAYRRR
jgi:hypothetical protein